MRSLQVIMDIILHYQHHWNRTKRMMRTRDIKRIPKVDSLPRKKKRITLRDQHAVVEYDLSKIGQKTSLSDHTRQVVEDVQVIQPIKQSSIPLQTKIVHLHQSLVVQVVKSRLPICE
jgi:hypothetical protein